MTDKNKALEALADAYVARGAAQQRVRAKYASFERELAEAKQEDIDTVAQALVAALDAGASVASAGRAMGTANIYNSRRAYYDRARELQGEAAEEDNEMLERLYRKARGESVSQTVLDTEQEVRKMDDEQVYTGPEIVDGHRVSREEWVSNWALEETGPNNYTVNDPQGRVEKIILGNIFGFAGKNATEFKDDAELHALVAEVHGIEMKEF
jgi:hypothetical protein